MIQRNWPVSAVTPETPIVTAMGVLNDATVKLVFVVGPDRTLEGVVTDGDIRRGLVEGAKLDAPISTIMNRTPLVLRPADDRSQALESMRARGARYIPELDAEGRIQRILSDEEIAIATEGDVTIVLMAGGLGMRLRPLTDKTPKPLLPIGGRPLLEITIDNLKRQGFTRFVIAVNYMADKIETHFGDGSRMDIDIAYLREEERLGTVGPLRLLPVKPTGPVLVMNGDILTTLDARRLIAFHREAGVPATMCAREHVWRVPYGVLRIDADGCFAGVDEKPARRELISAGINVLSPEALDLIPPKGAYDMPQLFERVRAELRAPAVFKLDDYWLDIGHLEDLRRAQDDVGDLFSED
jgi:dTDP-glucose pyrophosphorylase/CBS domain-containing protein